MIYSRQFTAGGEVRADGKKGGSVKGSEKAKHGGQSVRDKYGSEFYARIGKIGGEVTKGKLGSEHYAQIGKKGGLATKEHHGVEHYSRIGTVGGHGRRKQPPASPQE